MTLIQEQTSNSSLFFKVKSINSAACIIQDGEIIAEEERFSVHWLIK